MKSVEHVRSLLERARTTMVELDDCLVNEDVPSPWLVNHSMAVSSIKRQIDQLSDLYEDYVFYQINEAQ